jgi:hypothetical protein
MSATTEWIESVSVAGNGYVTREELNCKFRSPESRGWRKREEEARLGRRQRRISVRAEKTHGSENREPWGTPRVESLVSVHW